MVFCHFGSGYMALGPTAKRKYFSQVLLESRLESESFEALIGFLAFLVKRYALKTTN